MPVRKAGPPHRGGKIYRLRTPSGSVAVAGHVRTVGPEAKSRGAFPFCGRLLAGLALAGRVPAPLRALAALVAALAVGMGSPLLGLAQALAQGVHEIDDPRFLRSGRRDD